MRAIFTLCWGNLTRKKVQNLLIALLIAFSSLLIHTALNVLIHNQSIFDERHLAANGPHEMLNMVQGLHDEQKIAGWWANQEGVSASPLLAYRPWNGLVVDGQSIPNLVLYMMNTPDQPLLVDQLLPADDRKLGLSPNRGTIWIPTSIAYKYNIKAGDELLFGAGSQPLTLTVGAVVMDLSHGGPFSVTARIWMNQADYLQVSDLIGAKEQYMLSLRYEDQAQSSQYWQAFEKMLGTSFLEEYVSYDQMFAFYFIMNKVIGFVMSFLGLVMILVALMTIGFTITDTLLANYKTIGILQAMGLSSGKMIIVYMLQYGCLALLALVPAWIGSYYLSGVIIRNSLSSLQSTSSDASMLLPPWMMLSTGAGLLLLILLCVAVYGRRARQIEPIQAIRYGMSEASHNAATRNRPVAEAWSNFPIPVRMGWRQIWGSKKGSFLILLLTTISVAVLVFSAVLVSSVYRISETSPKWGYDNADVVLMVIQTNDWDQQAIHEKISQDKRISSITWSGSAIGVVSEPESGGQPFSLPLIVVKGSLDEMGLVNLTGRNPQLPSEISIGINIAKQLKKTVGDTMTLYLEGKPYTMLISGTYQSISNLSNTARITADRVTNFLPHAGYINLHNLEDMEQVVSDWSEALGPAVQVLEQKVLYDSAFSEAAVILLIPLSLLAVLFISITCFIIYSTCQLHLRKELKTYGIYALVGLTVKSIRYSLSGSIACLAAIGAGCGIFVGVHLLPAILRGLLSVYGIVDLPLIISWPLVIVLALVVMATAALGSWLSSKMLARFSLRMLVAE